MVSSGFTLGYCSRPREPAAHPLDELSIPEMSIVTNTETADQSASAPRDAHSPRPTAGERTIPPAGHDGHGVWACLRRQPIKMMRGRAEGGCTNRFEIICPDCGDHPRLEYAEVGPRLQRLRGPYTLNEGLAAYERHIGAR